MSRTEIIDSSTQRCAIGSRETNLCTLATMQSDAFQQQDREEQYALVGEQPPGRRIASLLALLGGERDHGQIRVGVSTELVRIGVMPGVLV